jgi:hypothetical protein
LKFELIPASKNICGIAAMDFCRQAEWENRRNATAFQGFTAPHGGKKTRHKLQMFSLAGISIPFDTLKIKQRYLPCSNFRFAFLL